MGNGWFPAALCATAIVLAGPGRPAAHSYAWQLPRGFAPVVPADNPMSAARVELGR